MDKENIMKALLQVKENNKNSKAKIEACINFEEVLDFSNKEETLPKLRKCLYHTETITHLCDRMVAELEKSTTDSAVVQMYFNEIKYEDDQLNLLADEYVYLRIKVPEEDLKGD
jgi:hypothetical protein